MSSQLSDSEERPAKRLRKGTHSCVGCRLRKIRCTLGSNSQGCKECISRGTTCRKQEIPRSHQSERVSDMQKRISDLESMLSQVVKKLDAKDVISQPQASIDGTLSHRQSSSMSTTVATPSAMPSQPPPPLADENEPPNDCFADAPLLSLFNNNTLSRGPDDHQEGRPQLDRGSYSYLRNDIDRQTLDALRRTMPTPADLASIFQASVTSWEMWEKASPCDNKLHYSPECNWAAKARQVLNYVNSGKLDIVAKMTLCIAISIQQLPGDFDYRQTILPASPEVLSDFYTSSIDKLLALDENFAGSLEGLECMMLQVRFLMNSGKLRKVWHILRAATGFAILMGLDRDSGNVHGGSPRRANLFAEIWQFDRCISLVLGLPYAIPESHLIPKELNDDVDVSLQVEFMKRISIAAGHIVERNRQPDNGSYAATLNIEQELEDCAKIMSSWEASATNPAFDEERAIIYARMVYHNTRKLLHLPFMLRASSEPRYQFSKTVALTSSREMIKIFLVVRDPQRPSLERCDLLDFLVLTAAIVLLLNILGSSSDGCADDYQQGKDWEEIKIFTGELQRVGNGRTSSVSYQSAKLLDKICKSRSNSSSHPSDEAFETVYLPYFGKIRFRRADASAPRNNFQAPAQPTPPDSVGVTPAAEFDPFVSFDKFSELESGSFEPWIDFELQDWTWT